MLKFKEISRKGQRCIWNPDEYLWWSFLAKTDKLRFCKKNRRLLPKDYFIIELAISRKFTCNFDILFKWLPNLLFLHKWNRSCFKKQLVRDYIEVYLGPCQKVRSSHPEVFLKQLYWNRTSACVFSCKFAAYFQNTFSKEHLWTAASEKLI